MDRFEIRQTVSADWEKVGKELTKGALGYLAWCVFFCFVLLAIIGAVFDWPSRDATDSATARSGLNLRTDHGTGCQYLETSDGGLTPRLGRDGKQVCQ